MEEIKKDINNLKKIALFAVLVLIIGIYSFISLTLGNAETEVPASVILNKEEKKETPDISFFKDIELKAESAIIFNIDSEEVVFERNANERMPLASITKILTALTALDLAPKDTTLTIDAEFLNKEGIGGLYAGERWMLGDLLDLGLVSSANDASYAVASYIGSSYFGVNFEEGKDLFIERMNKKAKEIGMENSTFFNSTGLDEGTRNGGSYGSAYDISKLMKYALKYYPSLLEPTRHLDITRVSLDNIQHRVRNTNTELHKIGGILGSKTGYTNLAGGNLAVIFHARDLNNQFVAVVLGSTFNDRFEDVEKLIKATREAYKN